MRSDELIERIRKGTPGAFEALYRAHVDQVYRQLSRLVGEDGDIDDLVQTVFIKVHRHLDGWRGDSQFSTWLHRIVVNVAMTHLKSEAVVDGGRLIAPKITPKLQLPSQPVVSFISMVLSMPSAGSRSFKKLGRPQSKPESRLDTLRV